MSKTEEKIAALRLAVATAKEAHPVTEIAAAGAAGSVAAGAEMSSVPPGAVGAAGALCVIGASFLPDKKQYRSVRVGMRAFGIGLTACAVRDAVRLAFAFKPTP